MDFTTLKIPGTDAIRLLREHRSRYPATGQYPFLIGDDNDLRHLKDHLEINNQDPDAIIRTSLNINVPEWISQKAGFEEEESTEELLGDWPGEIHHKGSIGLHMNVLRKKVKPDVYLGFANIEKPWQLPGTLKLGAWNDCPEPEIHCAFHREWHERFGAEITGVSGDVVECSVKNPPNSRKSAIALAWEQFWYCSDIVLQGTDSISNLAARLMNSTYWYFWWD